MPTIDVNAMFRMIRYNRRPFIQVKYDKSVHHGRRKLYYIVIR